MDENQTATLDCWAIVEMFGHQRIAGRVRSENFGAAVLLRVDVPEILTKPTKDYDCTTRTWVTHPGHVVAAFTKYLGVGSIYALNPVTEELARAAAVDICAAPVNLFGMDSVRSASPILPPGDDDEEADEEFTDGGGEETEPGDARERIPF